MGHYQSQAMIIEKEVIEPSISGSPEFSQCTIQRLPVDGCDYRGEGNANLVVALPFERKVIRIRKSSTVETTSDGGAKRVRREVEFIRSVISGFLGSYVRVPEILHCDQAEIVRLGKKIRSIRPENRRRKNVIQEYATKYPDYTFLPEGIESQSSKPHFCVEIKPKQGFICKPDQQLQKCPYCLTQYLKLQKGTISKRSEYCPFDLFSGDAARISRAVRALLQCPQNNLKIFKNGNVVYDNYSSETDLDDVLFDWFADEDPSNNIDNLITLIQKALLRSFDDRNHSRDDFKSHDRVTIPDVEVGFPTRSCPQLLARTKKLLYFSDEECDFSGNNLPEGSVLERILRMQREHKHGFEVVSWIYSKFSEILNDDMIYSNLTEKYETEGDDHTSYTVVKSMADKGSSRQRGNVQCCNWEKSTGNSISFVNEWNKHSTRQKWFIAHNQVIEESTNEFIPEEYLSILRNYLLFCTARDCSILMAFQEGDRSASVNTNSDNVFELSEDLNFVVSVRVLDLDAKSIKCIAKHQIRDSDVLRAAIQALKEKLAQKNQ